MRILVADAFPEDRLADLQAPVELGSPAARHLGRGRVLVAGKQVVAGPVLVQMEAA